MNIDGKVRFYEFIRFPSIETDISKDIEITAHKIDIKMAKEKE
jgi:hypothetical protein